LPVTPLGEAKEEEKFSRVRKGRYDVILDQRGLREGKPKNEVTGSDFLLFSPKKEKMQEGPKGN